MADQDFHYQDHEPEDDQFADDQGWSPEHDHSQTGDDSEGSDSLKDQERSATKDKTPKDDGKSKDAGGLLRGENDTVGNGYSGSTSGKGNKSPLDKLNAKLAGNSKLKKRIAIAGFAAGGSLVGGILLFFAMLPLKIEHVITNLESTFSAESNKAMDSEVENLVDHYFVKHIFPNLGKDACHSTISPGCVSDITGDSPIDKLFKTWKQARIENTLAKKYGIVVGKRGSTYYINLNGKNIDLKDGSSIFNSADGKESTRTAIRQAVRDSVKDSTMYDRLYVRFKVGKLLEEKYGIRRCVIACETTDKFSDTLADKKKAFIGFWVKRVISPMSETYGLILQCVMDGSTNSGCNTDPDSTDDGGDGSDKTSPFQRQLQTQLDAYGERLGPEAVKSLLNDSKELSEKGMVGYAFSKILGKLGASEATSETASKAVPVIGWINFASQFISFLGNAGKSLKAFNYAAASAAAVTTYMMFRTASDETHTGHEDLAEFGSFNDALSDDSNLDGKGSDMTAAPLYGTLMKNNTPSTTTALLDSLTGNAYADGTNNGTSVGAYKCNDGHPVAVNAVVCPEEVLNGGSKVANAISNAANAIPGFSTLKSIADGWNSTVGQVFRLAGNAIGWIINQIPGVSDLTGAISSFVQPLIKSVMEWLVPNPFAGNVNGDNKGDGNVSGGRIYDMMAAGADVSANKSCQIELGCASVTDKQVSDVRNAQTAEQQQEFNNKSMFARMFDTSTPYSLISRLAMTMPTNLLTATNDTVSSILSNPVHTLGSVVSSLFSTNHAFAAATAHQDYFGVPQVGYTEAQIPSADQQDSFWKQNCVNGPLGYYDPENDTLDVSQWADQQPQDLEVGESVAATPNPCLLVHTAIQMSGGIFDASFIPDGAANE